MCLSTRLIVTCAVFEASLYVGWHHPVVAAAVRAGAMLVVANAIVALVAYACRHCVSTNLNGIWN